MTKFLLLLPLLSSCVIFPQLAKIAGEIVLDEEIMVEENMVYQGRLESPKLDKSEAKN